MKAVLYARVSSREQEKEGFSIPAQVKLLEEYANRNNLTIVEHFSEAETAKSAGREEFNRMLEFIQKTKEPHCILVEKTDRLYRNFKDYVRLEELNLEVHFVKEGEIMSKDSLSHAKFIHGIKLLMAKNYIDNLSEEVKKGQREKAAQGHFPTVAPYGYKNNRDTRLIDIDPDEAVFVKRAFELYETREYSIDTLREVLYQEGFLYSVSQKRIPRTTLEKLLKNPLYMGDFVWAGQYYRGKHKPLVTRDQYDRVQTILSDRHKGQATQRDFQFTGILTCNTCNRAYTAELKKGKYIYYHCANRHCENRNKHIREELIEAQFLEFLGALRMPEEFQALVTKALKDSHVDEKEFHDQSISSIEGQLKKIQTRIEKIYDDKLDGVISEELWFKKHHEFIQEQSRLSRLLEEHRQGASNYYQAGVKLLELTQKAVMIYEKASNTEKRQILRFLSPNYIVEDGKVIPAWTKPFDLFMKVKDFEKWRGGRGSNPRLPA